jgi:hypothetical protein
MHNPYLGVTQILEPILQTTSTIDNVHTSAKKAYSGRDPIKTPKLYPL